MTQRAHDSTLTTGKAFFQQTEACSANGPLKYLENKYFHKQSTGKGKLVQVKLEKILGRGEKYKKPEARGGEHQSLWKFTGDFLRTVWTCTSSAK